VPPAKKNASQDGDTKPQQPDATNIANSRAKLGTRDLTCDSPVTREVKPSLATAPSRVA